MIAYTYTFFKDNLNKTYDFLEYMWSILRFILFVSKVVELVLVKSASKFWSPV